MPLQKQNNRLTQVINLSPIGIMAFDSVRDDNDKITDFTWTLSNKMACQMVSFKEEELVGKNLLVLMPGNKDEGLFDKYVEVVETGKTMEQVHFYHHEAVSKVWFRTIAQKSEDGFVVTFQDISEEKNLLEKVELAFESTQAGMWDWIDVDTDEEIWTDRFYQLLGYAPNEIKSGLTTFRSLLHPEDKDRTFDAIEEHFRTRIPLDIQYRLKTKKDGYKWFQGSGKSQFNATGKPVRMVGSIIDINERKILEANQQLLIDQLSIRNSQLSEFGHIVSHNIRGPIGNLNVLIELYGESSADEQGVIMEKIETVSNALTGLLEDLVETVMILEKENVRTSTIRVSDSINRAKELLQAQIENTRATFDIQLEWDEIEYYKLFLDSAMLNLLSNALKYHEPGRPLVISISTSCDHEKTLKVTDNGVGIDLQKHGKAVFGLRKRFHKNVPGKGLGLFLTKNQVQSMGGTIDVQSTVDEGTTFTIAFGEQ